ncbi:hypothetical protein [Thermococcus sp.]
MEEGRLSPSRMKWGISLIMTFVYSFGAAYFYYLPARGEPVVDVEFFQLLAHFLVLGFLFWIILVPERASEMAPDLLMFTILTVPAGVVAALLFLFGAKAIGAPELYGLEYFFLAVVPFVIAYKGVKGRLSAHPFVLALIYAVLAYLWGNLAW